MDDSEIRDLIESLQLQIDLLKRSIQEIKDKQTKDEKSFNEQWWQRDKC
jgi:hypothetical protein